MRRDGIRTVLRQLAPPGGALRRALLLAALVSPGVALADPVLRWSPADTLLQAGEQATLSVVLDDTLDVRTLELVIAFDPAVLATVAGGPGALFDGFATFPGFEETVAGQWHGYCVVLGADDWAVGPGELFAWTVEALADGVSPVTTVELTLLPPGGGDYPDAVLPDDQVRVGETTGAPALAAAAPALRLYPNPFNPRTRVELVLPRGGPALLEVVDLRGRVVATPWQGLAPANQPVLADWDGLDAAGRPAPSGVYRFRLLGGDGQAAWRRGVLVR